MIRLAGHPDAEAEAVLAVLHTAKDTILTAGWWNGSKEVQTAHPVCASQAIYQQCGIGFALQCHALAVLAEVTARADTPACAGPMGRVIWWNDIPGRTLAEVLDAFDAAMRAVKLAA